MVDAITITIILFLILNFIGVLFFNGKFDSKISTGTFSSSGSSGTGNGSYSGSEYNYGNSLDVIDDTYKMRDVNTTSVYNSIAPTIQQVKSNIITKLDEQKVKIQEHEKILEARKQELLVKQQQLQNEIDRLNETLQSSLSQEQLNQINLIKTNLKKKIDSIQTQLHGVDASKAQCVLPSYQNNSGINQYDTIDYNNNIKYRNSPPIQDIFDEEITLLRSPRHITRSERRDSRQSRRGTRQQERPRIHQKDWSSDWSLDNEFTRPSYPGELSVEDDITFDNKTSLDVNECFSSTNPFVNVFENQGNVSFAPY
jgi:hypothetical protein